MTIEEEIAETLKATGVLRFPGDSHALTAALSPLLNRVRAEALREAADDPSLRLSGHSGVSIRALRSRADAIEQSSEGNET